MDKLTNACNEALNSRFGICSCQDTYKYANETPAVHICTRTHDLMEQADRLKLLYRIAMGAAEEVNFDKECCEKFAFDALEKDLKAAVQKVKEELFL